MLGLAWTSRTSGDGFASGHRSLSSCLAFQPISFLRLRFRNKREIFLFIFLENSSLLHRLSPPLGWRPRQDFCRTVDRARFVCVVLVVWTADGRRIDKTDKVHGFWVIAPTERASKHVHYNSTAFSLYVSLVTWIASYILSC